MDRTNFLNKLWKKPVSSNQSSSSRHNPTFKPSLFTNMSKLSTTSFASPSSFYAGKIQYGGAMSASRINTTSPYVVPKVKKRLTKTDLTDGVDKNTSGSLSSTARKILHTLEKMSTPLRDIKKIPPPSIKLPNIFGRQHRKRSLGASAFESASSKKVCPPRSGRTFLTRTVNKTANIPLDNRLATHSLIKNISENEDDLSSSIASEAVHKGIPGVLASFTSSAGMKVKPPNSVVSLSGGGGGKMKNQRKMQAHYSAATKEDLVEEPALPDVTFNVTTLPAFNFTRPDSTSTPAPPKQSVAIQKNNLELEYTFAVPAKASPKIKKHNTSATKLNFNSPVKSFSSKHSSSVSSETVQKQSNSWSTLVSSSKKTPLKTGSVMEILKGDLVDKNTNSGPQNSAKPPLSELFQKPCGKWECEVCMVMNDKGRVSCIACESPKPGQNQIIIKDDKKQESNVSSVNMDSKKEYKTSTTKNPITSHSSATTESSARSKTNSKFVSNVSSLTASSHLFSFGAVSSDDSTVKSCKTSTSTEKKDSTLSKAKLSFAPNPFSPSKKGEQWTCDVCLVQNGKDLAKCAACENPNPAKKDVQITDGASTNKSTQFQFGLKSDRDVSLVQNKKDTEIRAACENPNPAKKNLPDAVPVKKLTNELQFGAKQNLDAWTCEVCLVPNTTDQTICIACGGQGPAIGGQTSNSKMSSSFKFGNTSSNVYKFGVETPKEKIVTTTTSTMKPSTASELSTSQATTVASSLSASGMKFGAPFSPPKVSTNLPGIRASISIAGTMSTTDDKKNAADSSNSSKSKTIVPTFNFGAKSSVDGDKKVTSEVLQTVTKPFSFGTSVVPTSKPSNSNQTVNRKPAFAFGTSATTAVKPLEAEQQPAINLTSQVTTAINNNSSLKPPFSIASNLGSKSVFGEPIPVSSTAHASTKTLFPGFGQQTKQTIVRSSPSKPASAFQFGSQTTAAAVTQSAISTTKTMFSFGNSSTTSAATISTSSQASNALFGSKLPTIQNQAHQKEDKPVTSTTHTFAGFGQQNIPSQESMTEAGKPSAFSGFGQQNNIQQNPVKTVSQSPFGGFGKSVTSVPQTKSNFSFGSSGISNNTFGKDASSLAKPQFSFGNNAVPVSQTPFGTNTNSNVFGNSNVKTATTSQAPPFQFGSGQVAAKNPTNMFSNAQANSKPAFGFGSTSTDNIKPGTGFAFGAAQTNAGNTANFKFGGSTTDKNPTPSAGFNFDAPKTMFSAQPQAPFQFGSSNQVDMQPKPDSTTNTGFQFNATSVQAPAFGQSMASNAASGVFSIGQSGRAPPIRAVKQAKRRLRK